MNETMQREIRAQAEVLPACLDPLASQVRNIPPAVGRIFAGGCGDSAFAPAALGGLFRSLGLDVRATTSMELAGYCELQPTDTIILSSISGGTRRTVEAAHTAKQAGARIIALTCAADSPLAQAGDHLILLPFAPISRKTPHTLDYLVTLQALAMLGLAWAGRDPRTLAAPLEKLPAWITLAEERSSESVARLGAAQRFVFLGGGPDLASAAYVAAKLHEAGGLLAIAAETENFIHGMNFILEPDDALITIATSEMSKKRGQEVCSAYQTIGVRSWSVERMPNMSSGPVERFSAVISATIELQFFCLKLAAQLGLEVERPRAGRLMGEEHRRIQTVLMAS